MSKIIPFEKYCFDVYRSFTVRDLRFNTFVFEANSKRWWNIRDTYITSRVKDRWYVMANYKYLTTIDSGPDLIKYSNMMKEVELDGEKSRF